MKNLSKFIFAFVIGLITFVSCDKTVLGPTIVITGTGGTQVPTYVVPQNNNGEFGIVFGGYTQATKASVSSVLGNGYDDFTLYAWNSNGTQVMNPYSVYANGNGYYYEGIGSQELQYFKNNTDYYDFIGIIPSSKVMTLDDDKVLVNDIKSFVVDDDRVNGTLVKDSPEEFLYSYKRVVKNNYNQPVVLPFEHGNALLYIGFKSDRDDTELLDYTPYNPGTPAQDAYDETVEVTTYQTVAKPVPMLGPVIGTITDEDIDYINSKYTSSLGWLSYYSSNSTFTGSLDENMWEYLVSKHSELTSEDLESWGTYANNSNMRLVHVDKNGKKSTNGDSYRGWFVNVQNVNWEGTTVTTTVHHDAVPAVPASGIKGIRVFSANYESEHYVHVAHTTNADATISSQGVTFNNRANSTEVIPFSLPSETTLNSTPVFSPTTFYAVPGDTNVKDFVVKFSYTYNGETVYDVRVPLVLPEGGLQPGKYYKYIINITSTANGNNNPGDAEDKKDDIDVVEDIPITLNVSVNTYNEGIETTYDI